VRAEGDLILVKGCALRGGYAGSRRCVVAHEGGAAQVGGER
jgi:hypothetical protein